MFFLSFSFPPNTLFFFFLSRTRKEETKPNGWICHSSWQGSCIISESGAKTCDAAAGTSADAKSTKPSRQRAKGVWHKESKGREFYCFHWCVLWCMWSAGGTSLLALGSICILSILTHYIAVVTCFIYTLDHKEQPCVFTLLLDKLSRTVFSQKLSNLNCFWISLHYRQLDILLCDWCFQATGSGKREMGTAGLWKGQL